MLVIPAIDLLDGKCVRLYKGDYDQIMKGIKKGAVSEKQLRENAGRIMHVINRLGKK